MAVFVAGHGDANQAVELGVQVVSHHLAVQLDGLGKQGVGGGVVHPHHVGDGRRRRNALEPVGNQAGALGHLVAVAPFHLHGADQIGGLLFLVDQQERRRVWTCQAAGHRQAVDRRQALVHFVQCSAGQGLTVHRHAGEARHQVAAQVAVREPHRRAQQVVGGQGVGAAPLQGHGERRQVQGRYPADLLADHRRRADSDPVDVVGAGQRDHGRVVCARHGRSEQAVRGEPGNTLTLEWVGTGARHQAVVQGQLVRLGDHGGEVAGVVGRRGHFQVGHHVAPGRFHGPADAGHRRLQAFNERLVPDVSLGQAV